MRTVRIAGTGIYTPTRSMPTEEVGAMLKLDLTQQIQTGGIKVKKIMADDEEASDLAVYAGMQALKNAGVKPSELDLIIVSTDTPDYISPCTASIVQHRLCLLYTSDAADDLLCVDLGGRRIIKK